MTMPQERMRSLRWGWDVLRALEVDLFGEPQWIDRAIDLVWRYPVPDVLERLVEAQGISMPATFQMAINEARALFEQAFRETRSPALRRDLQFTLRHYPSAGVAQAIVNAATQGALGDWLCTEHEG